MHSHIYKAECTFKKIRETLLTGYREPATKQWRFPQIENTPPSGQHIEPRINEILPDGTMSDTLNLLHQSMGSPTKTTLLNAIQKKSFYVAILHGEQYLQVSTRFNTHSTGAPKLNTEKLTVYSTINIQNKRK